MRLHLPSYLLGLATAGAVALAGKRLRPVAVEIGAVAVYLSRVARALAERQREHIEDLWAEIDDRVHQRFRRSQNGQSERAHAPVQA